MCGQRRRGRAPAARNAARRCGSLQKYVSFNFSYVMLVPEPVLANVRFVRSIKWRKKRRRFRTEDGAYLSHQPRAVQDITVVQQVRFLSG